MTIEEAKNIRLVDYLQRLGYTPVRQQGANLWYKSPFREETKASFKVNTEINKWYDFGLGQGGNIIALVSELYSSVHVPYLLQRIAEQTPHIRPVSFSFRKQSSTEPNFQRMEVRKLDFPVLLSYLQGRGINLELAKRECNEVHFENNGKRYFAIGFRNMAGGYEIRNRYFKGCIAPKDITHIRHEGRRNDTCFVFEGFIDYLSFLTIRAEKCSKMPCLDWQNYIILNSVSNLHKAIDGLAVYERIHCFFDNDRAGTEAFQRLANEYSYRVRDASHTYKDCKDLNEYLVRQRSVQEQKTEQIVPPKRSKGRSL